MGLRDAISSIQQSGVAASFFNFFQGRTTAFAIVFTIVGIRLAFTHRLTADYSLFVGAIQSLVTLHSWKEDVNAQKMEALRQTDEGKHPPCPPESPAVVVKVGDHETP